MDKVIQLLGFSGSLRKGSYNTMLLNSLKELLPENVSLQIVSIADIPFYNGDLDLPDATERPQAVEAFRDAISKADALVIVSPEYNYSIPGALKNAIDWASRGEDSPILKKTVSLMGASNGMWGTVRMQMAFQPVFLTLGMRQVKPEVYVSKAQDKFDKEGKLIDEGTKKILIKNLLALKEAIEKQKTY
ncbi:MAG: NADPH-dependent FMN reductase [Bacteroidota bacterium]